jgi:hypothetical protein
MPYCFSSDNITFTMTTNPGLTHGYALLIRSALEMERSGTRRDAVDSNAVPLVTVQALGVSLSCIPGGERVLQQAWDLVCE